MIQQYGSKERKIGTCVRIHHSRVRSRFLSREHSSSRDPPDKLYADIWVRRASAWRQKTALFRAPERGRRALPNIRGRHARIQRRTGYVRSGMHSRASALRSGMRSRREAGGEIRRGGAPSPRQNFRGREPGSENENRRNGNQRWH